MKVRDIMTKPVTCCGLDTNLAEASARMWDCDCGVLPVTEEGRLAGIITDRDICIALGTRNRPAAEVAVRDVATRQVQTVAPDADIHTAMAAMRRAKVRRLPVAEDGQIEGIVALNDIVEAVDRKHGEIDYEDVMNTIKAVSEHRKARAAKPSLAPATFPPIPVAVA